METEIRFYYSKDSLERIINYFKTFKELEYKGKFYECTDQYNHPMEKYNFYSKEIDGRFRIRKTEGENLKKCMISWKRRLKDNKKELIHQEEEVEISINPDEYENLCFLLEQVLHLNLVESYERYRHIFANSEIELTIDEYPFGICIEIENKSANNNNPKELLKKWLNLFNLDINNAYNLSWDDKYAELCQEQNKKYEKIVRFNQEMPSVKNPFDK